MKGSFGNQHLSQVIPGPNISGRKFQILLCSSQGSNFLPFLVLLCGVSRGDAEGGCVLVLTLSLQGGDYCWDKDKTHSRQALSDVGEML